MFLFRPDWRLCFAQREYVGPLIYQVQGLFLIETQWDVAEEDHALDRFRENLSSLLLFQTTSCILETLTFPRYPSMLHIILIFSPPSSTTKRNVPVGLPFGESPALFVCIKSTWHRVSVRKPLVTVFIVLFVAFSPVSF